MWSVRRVAQLAYPSLLRFLRPDADPKQEQLPTLRILLQLSDLGLVVMMSLAADEDVIALLSHSPKVIHMLPCTCASLFY